jgi:hypothetical protein
MAEEKQEGQKTVVSFIVGLLIGGLLVWAFSGPSADAPEEKKEGDKKEVTEDKKTNDKESTEEIKLEENKVNDEVKKEEVKASLPVGDGKVVVNSQAPSTKIKLDSATYPVKEGWIGVRDYQGGNLGGILGVVRFSEEQGLVPTEIILQRPTVAGKEYAVMIFEENGDRKFNSAEDKQLDTVFTTFKAE